MIKECQNCHLEKEHHAKGLCYACYKKTNFVPKIGICKRCQRKIEIHARTLCAGCYNYTFHLDKNKAYHHRKSNKVDLKTYKEVTKSCIVCGFDKVVDLHHIDRNKENGSKDNLIGLCPNHHRMIKSARFRHEILQNLSEKGFKVMDKDQNSSKKQGQDPAIKRPLIEFK